ncbi:Rha family transcriptional regulator [Bacillus mycoides]|uniref:Rha family transcriptional regulator n=1 Tax=Bacillus mycoides TaxID=1405 RepID=UPI0024AD56F7|nr:Rha family transcriptional regulator [Bacillus mycoides]MDI6531623.1 Rha family transcriptional regulator [Bacillus mycoides]WJE59656.1 Rha family transcriptional regulator [Bacillus mycoides]
MYITSLEVAGMTGKKHNHLLRDIEKYKEYLAEFNIPVEGCFIESTYRAGTGQKYKKYLLTRKGCGVVACNMTARKGTEFTHKYSEWFGK